MKVYAFHGKKMGKGVRFVSTLKKDCMTEGEDKKDTHVRTRQTIGQMYKERNAKKDCCL